MERLNLASPWRIFYKKIEALFGGDPEITLGFDEDMPEIKLFVDNEKKAAAISQILPTEQEFGNVTLKISVVPSNKLKEGKAELYEWAFKGNPAFKYAKTIQIAESGTMDFVVFTKKVVQYFSDDISDIHGLTSTLYADIAKNILNPINGVFYCTDNE